MQDTSATILMDKPTLAMQRFLLYLLYLLPLSTTGAKLEPYLLSFSSKVMPMPNTSLL